RPRDDRAQEIPRSIASRIQPETRAAWWHRLGVGVTKGRPRLPARAALACDRVRPPALLEIASDVDDDVDGRAWGLTDVDRELAAGAEGHDRVAAAGLPGRIVDGRNRRQRLAGGEQAEMSWPARPRHSRHVQGESPGGRRDSAASGSGEDT